ncbi:MAG: hypothetical protein J6R34_04030 [Clostridia bacterium]|nr:hypothetical protein [Clostridia bacterium]
MKKTISILLAILMITVALVAFVACNPDTPDDPCVQHTYSGDCDTICNNCGEVRTATADHTDSAYDGACDVCGEKVAIPIIANEQAWIDAFSFANEDNFTIFYSYKIAMDNKVNVYEIYFKSNGNTRQSTYYIFNVDPNREDCLILEEASTFIITKDLDGECWAFESTDFNGYDWTFDDGDFHCYGDDDSYFDEMIDETYTYEFVNLFSEFENKFNPATKMYEAQNIGVLEDVKIKFEDGRLASATIVGDGVTMECTATYDTTETIVFPERYTLYDIDEWNEAIEFAKSPNYRVVSSYETAGIEEGEMPDVVEMIFESDGVTKRTIYNFYEYDENGSKVLLEDWLSTYTITKLSDGTYWGWSTDDTAPTQITQEQYDGFFNECSMLSMYYNLANEFDYNPETKQYEAEELSAHESNAVVKLVNGRIVSSSITMDGTLVETIVTYGETETIDISILSNNN